MVKLKPFINDFATTHPILAEQWDYKKNKGLKNGYGWDISTPDKVTAGSKKKVWWKCEHGHSWESTINDRVCGNGCPICSGRKVSVNETDLATMHPKLAQQWHPTKNGNLKPIDVTAGSNRKIWWRCNVCHQDWDTTVYERTSGKGCPYCAGKLPILNKTDLATIYPSIAAEWHPTKNIGLKDGNGRDISTPDKVTANSHQKVWWKCSICNHEWRASVKSRNLGKCGCPSCSESKGELRIRKVLKASNICFETQYRFKNRISPIGKRPLKDDFAIFNKLGNVVGTIEYNGRQHYEAVDFAGRGPEWAQKEFEKTQTRDAAKTKYLQEHNIPQLIIPYWEFENIENLVSDFLSKINFNS